MTLPRELFRTERLLVRPLDDLDVEVMHAIYGDAETMALLGDGELLSRERCVEWVAVTYENYAARGYGMSTVVLQSSHEVVGFCGLVHPGGQPEPELKYAFLQAHWGKGLATEAARGMLAHGVEAFGMTRIIATVAPGNEPSLGVLRKVGMVETEVRSEEDGPDTVVLAWEP